MKNKMLGIFVCTLMIAAAVLPVAGTMNIRNVSDTSSNNDMDWWPMYMHDAQHTGYSTSIAPNTNNTLWSTSTGKMNQFSSPAVVDDRLYIGMIKEYPAKKNSAPYLLTVLQDGKPNPLSRGTGGMYCLDATTGSVIWDFLTGNGDVGSSPTVYDGKLYFSATYPAVIFYTNTTLFCLDVDDGSEIWNFTRGILSYCTPTVVDGKVYFGAADDDTEDGKLWCLDADDGSIIWTFTMGYQETMYVSSPAVDDGKVFAVVCDIFNTMKTTLYCVNADTGIEIWNSSLGFLYSLGSPTVVDGKVYFGALVPNGETLHGKLWCLDADDGSSIWTFTQGYWEWLYASAPAVAYGKVYAVAVNDSSANSTIYCLDADDGSEIWHCPIKNWVLSSPVVADDKIYIGSFGIITSGDGELLCLDATNGNLIWSYIPVNGSFSSFGIVNGRAYVADYHGNIYAFQDPNESPGAPTIDGETSGKAEKEYEYIFNATDPDGDNVKYYIDWGDNTSEWTDFNASGKETIVKHTWSDKGDYTIIAKAQDIYGAEGPEGTLDVTMPKNKAFNFNILEWFIERVPIAYQILLYLLGLQ